MLQNNMGDVYVPKLSCVYECASSGHRFVCGKGLSGFQKLNCVSIYKLNKVEPEFSQINLDKRDYSKFKKLTVKPFCGGNWILNRTHYIKVHKYN